MITCCKTVSLTARKKYSSSSVHPSQVKCVTRTLSVFAFKSTNIFRINSKAALLLFSGPKNKSTKNLSKRL